MSPKEMPKAYDPASTEQRLYEWWESRGYFRPRMNPAKKPWSITLPAIAVMATGWMLLRPGARKNDQ